MYTHFRLNRKKLVLAETHLYVYFAETSARLFESSLLFFMSACVKILISCQLTQFLTLNPPACIFKHNGHSLFLKN